MEIGFTAHNIRLDTGTYTRPDAEYTMQTHPWFVSARRVLDTVFPGDRKHVRVADLGCLEGGYAVEFARMGFQVVGIEVRESNIAACNYVKANTNLPNLEFIQDDAWNIAKYGVFDATFCSGLLYHFDKPRAFLDILSAATRRLMILQTHFSTGTGAAAPADKFNLSELTENEGLPGRWYTEYPSDAAFRDRETAKWSAWENRRSFWIQREYLLQAMQEAGFDLVMEQFDSLEGGIAEDMLRGYYKTDCRGTFVGVKTPKPTGGVITG